MKIRINNKHDISIIDKKVNIRISKAKELKIYSRFLNFDAEYIINDYLKQLNLNRSNFKIKISYNNYSNNELINLLYIALSAYFSRELNNNLLFNPIYYSNNQYYTFEDLNNFKVNIKLIYIALANKLRSQLKKHNIKIQNKANILVSTSNIHKIYELNNIFENKYNLYTLKDLEYYGDIIEDGLSFEENSSIKSKFASNYFKMPAIADDSGLCIRAMNWAPGIYSARFGGPDLDQYAKNNLILSKLEGIDDRFAYFICAMSLSRANKPTIVRVGKCKGEILKEITGKNGFGFDSIFKYESGGPIAEMSEEEKNSISHRRRACDKISKVIDRLI